MDEQYLLTTPENVPISYELAGLGSRFLAALLDILIISVVELGLFFGTLFLTGFVFGFFRLPSSATTTLFAILLLLSFALILGYPLLFEIAWNGQTPGKRKVGIRIIQDCSSPLTATAAVIRNVMRLIDFLPAYYIIGAVTMLIDGKSRRLGDIAAGTVCVKERRDTATYRRALPINASENHQIDAGSDFPNLGRLSYDERHLIGEYLLRRDQLAPEAAHGLAMRIATRIAAKLDIEPVDETPEDFLVRVAAAMDRRP